VLSIRVVLDVVDDIESSELWAGSSVSWQRTLERGAVVKSKLELWGPTM
jgi:hypothetical protein